MKERGRSSIGVDALARALVVRAQGAETASDVPRLRRDLRRRRLADTTDPVAALERARRWYDEGPARLYVCAGAPCRDRFRRVPDLDSRLDRLAGLPVALTECHGPCRHAPIATLRVDRRCAMFAGMADDCDWEAVLGYAERAARARTLLVDSGTAQPFVFDPVHTDAPGAAPLRRFAFLVGHVRGEGRYAERPGRFEKEVVGAWEAGGRFIALRMAVTYPLDAGRADVHQALVLVGRDPTSGRYTARAYTDGGSMHDYPIRLDGERVLFPDRVPGHGVDAAQARKILTPRAGGWDEVLEIQAGTEPFRPYSAIELRGITPQMVTPTDKGADA